MSKREVERELDDDTAFIEQASAPKRPPAPGYRAPQRAEQRAEQRDDDDFVPFESDNEFEFDLTKQPKGMDYQWNVQTVMGAPADRMIARQRLNRWTPVPAWRHPELSGVDDPKHADANKPIIIGGQMLQERPKHLTEKVKARNDARAREQVSMQMAKLRDDAGETGAEKTVKLRRKFVPVDPDE